MTSTRDATPELGLDSASSIGEMPLSHPLKRAILDVPHPMLNLRELARASIMAVCYAQSYALVAYPLDSVVLPLASSSAGSLATVLNR